MNKTLLNSMYRRRMSCPSGVQQLWDGVKVIRYQRQVPNTERIAKFMSRTYSTSQEEVTRQLNYCLRDGLLQVQKRKCFKGSKQGAEQEGYKLPEEPPERDRHDWYCFECHTGGDVIFCSGCHRVYHMSCINNLTGSKAKYLCTVCLMCDKPEVLDVKIKRLNRLITMTCSLLKERYNFLMNSNEMLHRSIHIGSPGAQLDIGDESWRIKFLIHKTMDLSKMINKARERQYSHLGQFIADARTIVHNVVIFHGVHSDMADDARRMLRDCQSEVADMRCCQQCYHSAHSKTSRHWFCRPCAPPHSLVYAKANPSAPYWPAKVLLVQGDNYEVKFFGGNHERATVSKNNVLPITTSHSNLQVVRTPSWTKACEELKRHQDMVAKGPPSESSSSSEDEECYQKKPPKVRERETKTAETWEEDEEEEEEEEEEEKEEEPEPPEEDAEEEKPVKEDNKLEEEEMDDEEDEPLSVRERRARAEARLKADPPPSVEATPTTPVTPTAASATTTPAGSSEESSQQPPVKRKRGRPPKNPAPVPPPTPRKRGRPPGSLNKKKRLSLNDSSSSVSTPITPKETKTEEEKPSEPEDLNPEPLRPESPTSSSKSFDQKKNEEEIVSSSCTEPQVRSVGVQTKQSSNTIQQLEEELTELKRSHSEAIKQLQSTHLQEITLIKKKQWCYNCEQEAIYHCCWNTAYCSTECQQVHWQREHKRVCRRKR